MSVSWYKSRYNRITLVEYDREDLWIDVLDPSSLLYGEQEDFAKKFSEVGEDFEGQSAAVRGLVSRLVLDWNLTHPKTDEPLPIPSEDPDSVKALPMDLVNKIIRTGGGEENPPSPSQE